MLTDERLALIEEVVPRTLRSLFMLRIALCGIAACLAATKIVLSPPSSTFLLDLLTDTDPVRQGLSTWFHAINLLVSGLLAAVLALVVTTLMIQARIKAQVQRETVVESNLS